MIIRLIFIGFLFLLSGCTTLTDFFQPSEDEASAPELPPGTLYNKGLNALKSENFKDAVHQFEELDRQHPYSPEAVQAQLNMIFAQYKDEKYEEAASATERFIRMHPRHASVPYAYYMRGLAKYKQISSAYNDQERTREARAAFQEVISRFPESDYAWEADTMLKLCRDRLAEQEMVVGRYYLDREQYIAAMNRFRLVIDNPDFNTTPYVEEALFSMVLASVKLGLVKEANDFAAVLGHNYPGSRFYEEAYDLMKGQGSVTKSELKTLRRGVEEGSLIKRILDGLRPGVPGL